MRFRKTMRHSAAFGVLWFLGACAGSAVDAVPSSEVRQIGGMRDVMRDGATEARVRLSDALSRRDVIAVGALAGLEGEITALDGQVWVTRAATTDAATTTGPAPSPDDHATLLTVASVGRWTDHALPAGLGGDALESWIAERASKDGIDATKPFAFVIEGSASALEFHVVRGACGKAATGTAADAPYRRSFAGGVRVRLVGFFAAGREGVMTHHGTKIHAHALLDGEGGLGGHVDAVTMAEGATLRLPARG